MPEQRTFDAVTPAAPSALPAGIVDQLKVNLDKDIAEASQWVDIEGLMAFQRVANFIAGSMIFLQENNLLISPLDKSHIRKRILGHWGTCPGINFVYAHSNYLISHHDDPETGCPRLLFVTGPGHGAPAVMATTFMEGSITRYYPQYPMSVEGLQNFMKAFSFPGGFPSHVNSETPGAIHEGGELGYALAVSYGSVMDKPDLITIALIGDGESETGPTSAAWHAHKFIDPAESGAVIPILHVNGYKIGNRTIPGAMDDLELTLLFSGYGHQVRIVEYGTGLPAHSDDEHDKAINYDMAVSMEWAFQEIRKIQQAARSGKAMVKPRWPMIVLRTPKGWTGPKKLDGKDVEGSWRAHQVPLPSAAQDDEQFKLLQDWLGSYKVEEFLDTTVDSKQSSAHDASQRASSLIKEEALRIIPKNVETRMGMIPESYKGYTPLTVPDWKAFSHGIDEEVSAMKAIGSFLVKVIEDNPVTFRIFSPDEITSNKLDEILKVTHRNSQFDPELANSGGRLIEMLSEHTLQGFMQGYALTGRTGLFPSYESFLGIVTTMIEQYAKFVKLGKETRWRGENASLNYIETSTLWRQEHNGYSHQNPGLISSFISLPRNAARIYFPAEANTAVSVMAHCLRSKDYINLIVGSKNPTRVWLSQDEADRHSIAGASVWAKYSTDGGVNPDVVLVGIGVEVTQEAIAAAAVLRNEGVRVRLVNVVDLMILGEFGHHPHALTEDAFNSLFTTDKPVIINFHGYPKDVAGLLFARKSHVSRSRFEIRGYEEQGSTTTPYSMLRVNRATRYDLAEAALRKVALQQPNRPFSARAHEMCSYWKHTLREHEKYTLLHGTDPDWTNEILQLSGADQ